MAMEKTGYSDAVVGTTKVKLAIDENGYIAPQGVAAAGTKNFQLNRVNADNGLVDNTDVIEFFITLANGRQDSLSNTMNVKWGV